MMLMIMVDVLMGNKFGVLPGGMISERCGRWFLT